MKLMILVLAVSFAQVSYADTFQECMGHGRYMSNDERDNRVRRCNREHSGILHDLFGHDEDDEPAVLSSGSQLQTIRTALTGELNCVSGTRDDIRRAAVKCASRDRFKQSSKNENQYRCKLDESNFLFVTMNDTEVSRLTIINGARGGSVTTNCTVEDQ